MTHALVLRQRHAAGFGQLLLGEQGAGLRVVEDVGQLVGLGQGIDRHEHRADFEHGIHRRDHFHTVVEKQRYPLPPLHPVGAQRGGNAFHPVRQIAIARGNAFAHQRTMFGKWGNGRLEGVVKQHGHTRISEFFEHKGSKACFITPHLQGNRQTVTYLERRPPLSLPF